MESWDSMVKVTYHDLYTICASEGTAACWNSAGWVTQTSISKWRPWTWPRTAAIAWGPSWCRLCSLSVPWLLGVAASKHFSCNIKKNNLHPVLNFFQATCYPIFFHFEQQRHFFQILVVFVSKISKFLGQVGLPTCDGCFFWYPSTTNNSVEIFSIPTCPKNLEIFDLQKY